MKQTEIRQLSTKTVEELHSMLKDAKNLFFSSRMDHAQNKLKNTSSLFYIKKDIARIKTALRRKELSTVK